MARIIYALKCPFTEDIHHIGMSERGIVRPKQHISKSHSHKIQKWVSDLKLIGSEPVIKIIEHVSDFTNIFEREAFYIRKYLEQGCVLLNKNNTKSIIVNKPKTNKNELSSFVKSKRLKTGLTQIEFSEKSGVALTVIRKIEQGKTNINLQSLITVLNMFGHTLSLKINK